MAFCQPTPTFLPLRRNGLKDIGGHVVGGFSKLTGLELPEVQPKVEGEEIEGRAEINSYEARQRGELQSLQSM